MRKIVLFLSAFCLFVATYAREDYSLVGHNLTPFSLNPSLAGNAYDIRFGLSYRQQWLALGNNYHTVRASYDQSFHKRICSVGFVYAFDNMSKGVFTVNEFSPTYAHTLKIKDEQYIRLGLQGSLFLNHLSWDKVKYGDQYDMNTRRPTLSTLEEFDEDTRVHFDFSVGLSYVLENRLTVGAAVYHITEPNNGFMELKDNVLHRKYVGHINFVQDLQYSNGLWGRESLSGKYLFLNGSYQRQADYQMLNVGIGFSWDPLMFGVSDKNNLDGVNVVGLMAGGHYKGVQFYYVYDLFTSKKKNGSWSHEFNFIYIIKHVEKYPCPAVYW